ncbi:MAG TPA: hypothetical protein VL400_17575, partial [Polyangiaceae bacterium]|nr:hypothetical protein [Polyangiaceae bacterium]
TRKVTVNVTWQEGGRDYTMSLEQWITSSKEAGLGANVNGLMPDADGEEDVDSGSTGSGSNGSRGGGKTGGSKGGGMGLPIPGKGKKP